MIIITGAAGFIGSCMTAHFNEQGRDDLILVDDFSHPHKAPNFQHKQYSELVERALFPAWLESYHGQVEAILHLGARTDTSEQNWEIFDQLNLQYSQWIWQWCSSHQCPLIYASSAATYGNGSLGFGDDHQLIPSLDPLNPYGRSKQLFDLWALSQEQSPPWWAGLKFFNVYGPNEYHKGRMASVVFHAFHQIRQRGKLRLFRSHRPDIRDGEQSRDFIYVKDLIKVVNFLLQDRPTSGIYNLGTGQARTFLDLASALFASLDLPTSIEFIDTPEDIRSTYQYYTQAEMHKLRKAGFQPDFLSLEAGINAYVKSHLLSGDIW